MVIVAAALVLVTAVQGSERLPGQGLTGEGAKLFRQVITTPTGNNGYEEYVEAAALLLSDAYKDLENFESWVVWGDRFKHRDEQGRFVVSTFIDGKGEERKVRAPEPPRGLTYNSSMLEVQQAFVQRFGGVVQLVERGNRKTVFQPRESMDLSTTLPELGGFKGLAKLLLKKAEVEYATGSTASATNTLIEGMTFAKNISQGSLINALVGYACYGIMLAGFEKGLGRMSLADANATVKACNQALSGPPTIQKALFHELAAFKGILDSLAEKPESLHGVMGENGRNFTERFMNLDVEKRRSISGRVKDLVNSRIREYDRFLAKPEKEWHRTPFVPFPVSMDERDLEEALAAQIANSLMPNYEQSLSSQALRRAQIRCLRASARVVAFKWLNWRMPKNLEEAMPESEIEDPASGGKLKYFLSSPWAFEVKSPGFGSFGEFGIRSRPSAQSGPDDQTGPPPPK